MYSIRRLLRSATAFSLQQIRRADEAFRIGRDTVLGISNDCVASTKQVAMSDTLSTDPGISVGDVKKVYETEQRMAMKDLVSVKKRIDHHGGEIRNETFGISLFIPPGALAEGAIEVITLTILTEKPASLKLQDDEMIVSCGFKCSPPGLKFLKPVHLTIPHCAVLTDPAEAQTTLYLCDERGLMARQKTSSDTCVARRNQFDVFLTQLSSGWPTIVYKEPFVSHLKILCEVYFPRKVRMDGDALPFEVCLYKDFKGVHETKQYKRHENSVMVEGFPVEFLLSVEDSYTTVKCDAGPFALKRKQQTVDLKELHDMVVEKVIPFSFEVDDKWNSIYSTINMRMIIGTTPGIHTLASLQDGTFRLQSEEGKGVINRFAVEPVHPAPSEGKSDSTTSPGYTMSSSTTCTREINHRGGELRNETFGISLSIPPGALAKGTSEVITLTILTEKPASLKLQEDDMIVSCGFECSPPGLKFLKPVRLKIPHCAFVFNTSEVEPVLYLGGKDGNDIGVLFHVPTSR